MQRIGKFFSLALVGSTTVIIVTGMLSFTATQFVGSGDTLQLDVDVKPDNVKLRAAVNSDEGKAVQPGRDGRSEPTSKVNPLIK